MGNLTGVTEADGSTDTYDYGALYRLTSEVCTGTSAGSYACGYDLAGNLTNLDGTIVEYDAADKITSYGGNSFFSYDKDGNLSSSYLRQTSFGWDDRGDLTSRTGGSPLSYAYGYNALDQRVHTVFTAQG